MPHLRYILLTMGGHPQIPQNQPAYVSGDIQAAVDIASQGKGWKQISAAFGCDSSTLFWKMERDAILKALLYRARAVGQDHRADEVNSLVDDNQALPEDQRLPADLLKIKADAMKWWLGVMQPNRFGQRQTIAVERVDVQGAIQEARDRVSRRSDTVELPIASKVLSLGNAGLDYEHLFS